MSFSIWVVNESGQLGYQLTCIFKHAIIKNKKKDRRKNNKNKIIIIKMMIKLFVLLSIQLRI